MTPRRPLRLRLTSMVAFVLASALLVSGVLASPASAATSPKKLYGADISLHIQPPSTEVTFTFTLTNESKSQMIGSANLTAPPGFTITPGQLLVVTVDGVPQGEAEIEDNTIQLRDLGLMPGMPGETATLMFTAETPSVLGVYMWLLDVRQANDFRGSGNSFAPDPNNVHLKTGVGALTDPAVTTCTAGASCDGTATDGSTTADVQVDPGATPAVLTVTLFPTNIITCSDGFEGTYEGTSATVDFEVTPAIDRTKTVTITISPDLVGERLANTFEVCYSSPNAFMDKFEETVNTGLLPDCAFEGEPIPPCVQSRFDNDDGSVSLTFVAPESDPKGHI